MTCLVSWLGRHWRFSHGTRVAAELHGRDVRTRGPACWAHGTARSPTAQIRTNRGPSHNMNRSAQGGVPEETPKAIRRKGARQPLQREDRHNRHTYKRMSISSDHLYCNPRTILDQIHLKYCNAIATPGRRRQTPYLQVRHRLQFCN